MEGQGRGLRQSNPMGFKLFFFNRKDPLSSKFLNELPNFKIDKNGTVPIGVGVGGRVASVLSGA